MRKPITVSAIRITPVDGEKEANVEKKLRLFGVAGNCAIAYYSFF